MVVKNKRNLSSLEFYSHARKMREDLTNFLLRDFGVRNKVYKQHTPENQQITVIEEYPQWLIDYFRKSIITLLNCLMNNIVAANSIYPITIEEVNYRRVLQDKAIANCEQLFQELTYLADMLPISLIKVEPYADVIDKEIALLKGWRKSTNAMAKKVQTRKSAYK
jgi:hypothetical protein